MSDSIIVGRVQPRRDSRPTKSELLSAAQEELNSDTTKKPPHRLTPKEKKAGTKTLAEG